MRGAEDDAGVLHLGGGEDLARCRLDGSWTVVTPMASEMVDPVLLRDDVVLALRAVGVAVDQAGDDGLAGDVDDPRAGRDGDPRARADRADAVAVDQDGAAVDHLVAVHGDDRDCRHRRPGRGRSAVVREVVLDRAIDPVTARFVTAR